MAREDLHFRLRIPEALKAKIEKAAEENRRSMTAEIVDRLELTFAADEVRPDQNSASWAIAEAARVVEDAARQTRQNAKVLEWMAAQQDASLALLEVVAASDGNLSPEFLAALRKAIQRRGGEDAGFPKLSDAD